MKGISKEFINKLVLITLAGVIIWNIERVIDLFTIIRRAFTPIFIGVIFALIINVPMQFFETKIYHKKKKYKQSLSLWSSVFLFIGFLVGFGFLVFPKLIDSIKVVAASLQDGNAFESIASSNMFFKFVAENLQKVINDFASRLQEYVPKMIEIASNILRVIINIFLGLFISILLLSNKQLLRRQFKRLLLTISKRQQVKDIMENVHLAVEKFSKYMGGMLIEAIILGVMCYILMTIIGFPFAALISVIIGLVNLIPIVGAYAGGALSALLIFSVNPQQALMFVIFIIILQQLESVTTYPAIVGKHVGLSSFWILVSIILGGSLFGFIGVFLAVPVMAFSHDFVRGLLSKRQKKSLLYLDEKDNNMLE